MSEPEDSSELAEERSKEQRQDENNQWQLTAENLA